MSTNFMSAVKGTLNDEFNVSVTENGAVGYRTSGKELLDINFAVASLRRADPKDIYDRFMRAFFEDKVTAMKWLFFARDVRGGLGERRLCLSGWRCLTLSTSFPSSTWCLSTADMMTCGVCWTRSWPTM